MVTFFLSGIKRGQRSDSAKEQVSLKLIEGHADVSSTLNFLLAEGTPRITKDKVFTTKVTGVSVKLTGKNDLNQMNLMMFMILLHIRG